MSDDDAAKCNLLLSVTHDDCCCAGRAVEFECMTLLSHYTDFARVQERPISSRDGKGHLDITLEGAIV